jgi:hypothetical protein
MKQILPFFAFLLFILPGVLLSHENHRNHILADIKFDVDDGSLFIRPDYHSDEQVEIDSEYRLYVNGNRVRLSGSQQGLVRNYYNTYNELMYSAARLGKKAAKIGVMGAKLGITAAAGVLKVLFTEDEMEDLEDDLAVESEEIESYSSKLEEEAGEIEDLAERFKSDHRNMKNSIPALDRLSWF